LNYQQTLDYLYSFINYEKTGMPAADPAAYNLERIARLLARLDNPHLRYPSIVIAGTKGKGSTASFCGAALQAAGYRVGLYTQPHLHTYRERMQVNGQIISREGLVELVAQVQPHIEKVLEAADEIGRITTYEIGTALVLEYFAREKVDIAVLEIGLGGRLDAVNVVTPLVSVISSISYDHTAVLGNTLALIAGEKAGIVKPGVPVISAAQQPEAGAVIQRVCRERNAPLYKVGEDFKYAESGETPRPTPSRRVITGQKVRLFSSDFELETEIPLGGLHQQSNAALAFGTLLLQSRQPGGLAVSPKAIARGFAAVQWPARLEVLEDAPGQPLVIADGAHNADSAARLRDALVRCFYFRQIIYVVGTSADKDIEGIFRELGQPTRFVLTRSQHPRAATPEVLQQRSGVSEPIFSKSVREGLEKARALAGPQDLICVTGSLFVAAEAREVFGLAHDSDGRPD
jgi:dihydrofolate synthase/folylpolyglutamate synthase